MSAYLDNSATTKPCDRAVDRMMTCLREGYFNPSSLYAPAIQAEKAIKTCADQLRQALNADGHDVLFTSGGTEANNLAILGVVLAMHGLQKIVTTAVEHPSVLEPMEALRDMGHELIVLRVDARGVLDEDALAQALAQGPSLLSLMQVNNETGAVNEVAAIAQRAKRIAPNCLVHVDAVQGFLRLPLDARGIDMLTVSAHKIHGPKGIGALLARKGVRLRPRQLGGGQQEALRSGTENTPGIAGLMGAVEHMRGIDDVHALLMAKKRRFFDGLAGRIDGVLLNGPSLESGAPHIINLSFPGVRGEVLLHALEADGVYCSTGSACSSKKRKLSQVLLAMGIHPDRAESALRFSFAPDTTDEQIDFATRRIAERYAELKRFRRR